MSTLVLDTAAAGARTGLKGPRAAAWLAALGVAVPPTQNSWERSMLEGGAPLLVARLGASEFFLEGDAGRIDALARSLDARPAGVYPVLREDVALEIGGAGVHDALAQVCNVEFAALPLERQPLVLTLMVGVAVLIVPPGRHDADARYRIWCDPTYGPALTEHLEAVVRECGGLIRNGDTATGDART